MTISAPYSAWVQIKYKANVEDVQEENLNN